MRGIAMRTAAAAALLALGGCGAGLPRDPQGALPTPVASRSGGPPNIVLILADDLGYDGLSAFGAPPYRTPRIDALAADGVRFTNAHVSAPVCAPSRAGLLTGRSGVGFGFEWNPGDQQDAATRSWGLPVSEPTLAERLKSAGYVTGMVGKWHLGSGPGLRPWERGFDMFFGVHEGAFTYLSRPAEGAVTDRVLQTLNGPDRRVTPVYRDDRKVRVDEYLTDRFTHEGRAFIRRHADRPFFLYMAYNAPHSPFEAPRAYLARYPHLTGKTQVYAAMMAALDDGVGALVSELKARGLYENTIIVFLSDNGCPPKPVTREGRVICSNAPFSGWKATHLEGGLRVPMIVTGLPSAPKGAAFGGLTSALDVAPTVLRSAGAPADPGADGRDLSQVIRDGPEAPRRLFWRVGESATIIAGHEKLYIAQRSDPQVKPGEDDPPLERLWRKLSGREARIRAAYSQSYAPEREPRFGRHVMLFDLDADPAETRNLAASRPERVAVLKGELDRWNAAQPERPMWGPDNIQVFVHDGQALAKQ